MADTSTRMSILRSHHTPDLRGNPSYGRRRQDFDGARKSIAFEADENDVRLGMGSLDNSREDSLPPNSNRLQEIRRRMEGLSGRDSGTSGARVGTMTPEGRLSVPSTLGTQDYLNDR